MNFGGIDVLTLLAFIAFISQSYGIGIDDKIDFGGERKTYSSFRNKDTIHDSSFLPIKTSTLTKVINSDNGDDFDKIGVVCVNEGCNTTKSSDKSENTIKTDVVVHIETKVDLNQNKTPQVDNTPDVPIVIGTDTNSQNDDGIRTEPKSIFIPNEPHYFQNTKYNIPDKAVYPSSMSSYPFQFNRRIDSTTAYQDMFNLNPEVNIDIKSLPPIAIDMSMRHRTNGIEMSVPYFDPSHHNHHYGETPPPQYVYYSKNVGVMNPVEFKVMRPIWTPSQWQNQFNHYRHNVQPLQNGEKCFCETGGVRRNSYPNNRRSSVSINDPGSQINDKLAPLN